MKRREFIALIGGATAAWPVAAHAQQTTQIRRVGVLMGIAENDPGAPGRIVSIERPLRELGWVLGRNIELLYRWGAGDTDLTRAYAKELIEVQPDVILAHTNTGMDGCAAP
jgi:putative tryptophan/tyrosine transport system substrate-binding protein